MNEVLNTKKASGLKTALAYIAVFLMHIASVAAAVGFNYASSYYDSTATIIAVLILSVLMLIVPSVAEFFIARRFKDRTSLFMSAVFIPYVVGILVFAFLIESSFDLDFVLGSIMFIFIALSIRAVIAVIESIANKKYSLLAVCGVICFFAASVSFFGIVEYDYLYNSAVKMIGTGEPDRTGSWGSINQQVSRQPGWEQIVKASKFKLGAISDSQDGLIQDFGDYPQLDGSTVCVPMAVEFARQHLGFTDDSANNFVSFSTTHYAYESLIRKERCDCYYTNENGEDIINVIDKNGVDLVIATEPSDDELAMAESNGVTLVKKPVCFDAFVFITHKDNPVTSLTVDQIRKIYSGEITNWKEVGGNDEKITAFQREANSGSQTAMENLVMGGKGMIDPITVMVIEGMGQLVDEVAEYENKTASLGYTYRYYIDTLYKNDNIKMISVDGVQPNDENIRNKSYPFTTNYYGVIRKGDEKQKGGKFLDWMLSDEGQKCIGQAGYITLR